MEPSPTRLSGTPSWLITQLAIHAHRLVANEFAKAGARGYHYRLLAALQEFGAASQASLGRRCRMDPSHVVASVNELAELGHVERTPDPEDRRRNTITITEDGARRLRLLDGNLNRAQERLLAPLTADQRSVLITLLGLLLDHHGTAEP